MSLTTVAELRAALGVGTLYADATLQSVCDAADDVLLPFVWSNTEFSIAHKNLGTVGTLYFDINVKDIYYVGQTINVEGAGPHFSGNKTILSVDTHEITVTTSHLTDTPYHPFNPYAIVKASEYLDPADVKAIQEASLMVAIDIWQSRQAPSSGGVTIDGYQPSPYRMGNTLLARVRGLLAPYLDPRSMVG
jgi:hypothetical protein